MDPPSGCNVSSISYYFTFHVSDELHIITIFVNENQNVFLFFWRGNQHVIVMEKV